MKKHWWLTIAHVAVAGGAIAGAVMFPPLAAVIIGVQAMVNGLIPSPLSVSKPSS
jgi:hypothetical protein